MSYQLRTSKRVSSRWLSPEQLEERIFIVDLLAKIIEAKKLRIDIDLMIQSIRFPMRGFGRYSEYHLGCTSATIQVIVSKGEIIDFTKKESLDADYENSTKKNIDKKRIFTPELSIKHSEVEASLKGFGGENNRGIEQNNKVTYKGKEYTLMVKKFNNVLKWEIIIPRGEKIISDFFSDTLPFFLEYLFMSFPTSGRIILKSGDTRFFDAERRPLEGIISKAMQIKAFARGISLKEASIIDFDFSITEDN